MNGSTPMSKIMLILIAVALAASAAAGVMAFRGQFAKPDSTRVAISSPTTGPAACCAVLPKRFGAASSTDPTTQPSALPAPVESSHAGMKWIAGGEFAMGSQDADARADERPIHRVRLDGFWIDQTLVTNAQFRRFVEATGYVTTAEKKPDWEEMKKQLPPGTPKPPEDKLVAASHRVSPAGPGRCRWTTFRSGGNGCPAPTGGTPKGRAVRSAARTITRSCRSPGTTPPPTRMGGQAPADRSRVRIRRPRRPGRARSTPGATRIPTDNDAHPHCNIWQGHFPDRNTATDGYERSSPSRHSRPMATACTTWPATSGSGAADWYRPDTYAADAAKGAASNPTGSRQELRPR